MGRVCIDIFKAATGCIWKGKLTTLQNILSSPPFGPELFLLNSSLPFNPQILSLIPCCLHSDLGLSADIWVVGIGDLARCCKGSRCRYLICEERGPHAQSENIGRRRLSTSSSGRALNSFISYEGGNGLKTCR